MARHTQLKNNKAYIIFNTVLKKISENKMEKIRVRLGIPESGFNEDGKAFDTWLTELEKSADTSFDPNIPIEQKKNNRWDLYLKIKNKIKLMDSRLSSFGKVISEYITLGWPTNKTFFETNTTGCEMIIINDKNKGMVDAGVYLRIGEYSLVEDVKKFVIDNKEIIDHLLLKSYGIPTKIKKTKTQDFYKNNAIFAVSRFSIKFMRYIILDKSGNENLVLSNRRADLACRVLDLMYGIKVSPESYQRQMRKEKQERKRVA